MPGNMTMDALRDAVAAGTIDTVLVGATDMQGRLQGKRLHGHYFLDHVLEDGTEGCNYLLAVDVDMNTVDGYAISSWERGYGDMFFEMAAKDIRGLPKLEGTVHVNMALVLKFMASYLFNPDPEIDLGHIAGARALVARYLLPAFRTTTHPPSAPHRSKGATP